MEIDNPRSTIVNGDDVDVDNGFGGASIERLPKQPQFILLYQMSLF